MKLTNNESLVFTNVIISAVFQILSDDRWAPRSRLNVHFSPSPIKHMTPFMHIPLVHDTFPIYFDNLPMDFGKENVFQVQKLNH
jgi:hypothetical protein